jgi:hypothetical protein
MVANQALLTLVTVTSLTGFTDLGTIALGFTAAVPFELAVAFGLGLGSTVIIGTTMSALELVMSFRERRTTEKELTPGAMEERPVSVATEIDYTDEKAKVPRRGSNARRSGFAISRWSRSPSDVGM